MLKIFRREKVPNVSRFTYPVMKFLGIDAKSDQSSLPLGYASYAYNVAFRDGKLTRGMGISDAQYKDSDGQVQTLPNTSVQVQFINKMFFYRRYDYNLNKRDDRIIVQSIYNEYFVCDFKGGAFVDVSEALTIPQDTLLSGTNYHLDGEDLFLLYLSSGGMYVYDGTSFTFYDTPKFNSACIHYERAWATEYQGANNLYFSKALEPTNFSVDEIQGGYISFPDDGGAILKVVSFKDYLYVFREFAIHRLVAYTDPRDYKLSKVFSSNNKIYPFTIEVTGDKIIFFAQDGFYSFDGFSAQKVYERITPLIESIENASACFFNQKYYVALKLKNIDNASVGDEALASCDNNCVIAFDQNTNDLDIMRGVDIRGFVPVNIENICEVFTYFNNFRGCYIGKLSDDGKLFGSSLKKLWQSPLSNLNSIDRYKILRWLFVSCYYNATVCIEHNDGDSVFYLETSFKPQRLSINKKADSLAISIVSTDEDFFVSGFQLHFDLVRRYYAN